MAITITYTFTPNTTALSAEVNANFSLLASRATDKTGDTLTGTLNTQHLIGTASNSYDLGSTTYFYRTGHLKTSLILGQTTANYTITWANPASARAVSFEDPGGTDILVYKAATQTLTNKIITLSGALTLSYNTPVFAIRDTSQALPGGLWRWVGSGGTFALQRNTAAGGDFSAATAPIAFSAADAVTFVGAVTVNGASTLTGAVAAASTVKSSGQPGFYAYNTASDVTQANQATVQFDTELFDTASNFASNAFTAPVTGIYLFAAGVTTGTGSATQDRSILLDVNGGQTQLGYLGAIVTTTQYQIMGTIIMSLTAADVVSIKLGLSTGTCTVNGGFGPVTWFCGRLLV